MAGHAEVRPAPELLAPAGSLKHMRTAFAFGADAVYAGLPRYSLRARNNAFDHEALAAGIREAHAAGRRFFVACNILPHNNKLAHFVEHMEPIVAMGPDALIMADPGLIAIVRERWPELPVHLSVQANTMNWASVRFWQSLGIRRVILSRELSLDEVEEIRQRCPDIELEVFVHGALCIAYSGRCLLSGYFNHRDANQGVCTNACRWEYGVHEAVERETGEIVPIRPAEDAGRHPRASRPFVLGEATRPDAAMPVLEDEHGTYIMNSKDLRAIEHVARLVSIGVDSLKIEGRTKSPYYVARVTRAYRQAIDDAVAGRPFDARLLDDLDALASRGYTDGFYTRKRPEALQNYADGVSRIGISRMVGELAGFSGGWAEIEVRNRFAVGDELELVTPQGVRRFRLDAMRRAADDAAIELAPGSGYRVRIPLEEDPGPVGFLARIEPARAAEAACCS